MASNTMLLYSHSHANPESSIYKISGNNKIHPYSSMTNPGLSINPARRSTSSRYSSVFPSLLENLASQQSQTKRNNKVLRFSVEEKENKFMSKNKLGKENSNLKKDHLTTSNGNQSQSTTPVYKFVWSSIQFSDRQPIRKHSNFKADDSNTNVTGSYPPSNKKSLITPTIRKTFNNDEQSQESFKTNPRNEMILKQENIISQNSSSSKISKVSRAPPVGKRLRSASLSLLKLDNDKWMRNNRGRSFSISNQASGPHRPNGKSQDIPCKPSGIAAARPWTVTTGATGKISYSRNFSDWHPQQRKLRKNSVSSANSRHKEDVVSFQHRFPTHQPLKSETFKATDLHKQSCVNFDKFAGNNSSSQISGKMTNLQIPPSTTLTNVAIKSQGETSNSKDSPVSLSSTKDLISSQTEVSVRTVTATDATTFRSGLKKLAHQTKKGGVRNVDFLTSEQLLTRESIEKVQKWLKTLPKHFDRIEEVLPAVTRDY